MSEILSNTYYETVFVKALKIILNIVLFKQLI